MAFLHAFLLFIASLLQTQISEAVVSVQGMWFKLTVVSLCKEPSGILIQRGHPEGNGSSGLQTGTVRCSSYSPKRAAVEWASSTAPLWCHQKAPGVRRERSIRQEGAAADSPHRTSSDPVAGKQTLWTCHRNKRKHFTPCSNGVPALKCHTTQRTPHHT